MIAFGTDDMAEPSCLRRFPGASLPKAAGPRKPKTCDEPSVMLGVRDVAASSCPRTNVGPTGSLMSRSDGNDTRRSEVATTAQKIIGNMEKVIIGKRHQITLTL